MKEEYCFYCNKNVIPEKKILNNVYTVRKEEVNVKEEVYLCPNCKNELLNEHLDDSLYKIYDEYLKLKGLSFEKLKLIRKSFNLSQELFAKALNWSKKTVVRYENAESLPSNQYLSVYKKIEDNKNEFLNILKSNKNSIDKKVYYKIYDLVTPNIDLKTINVLLYILKDNYLNKTQIMKNIFAIDFLAYKELGNPITKLVYAHGNYGPVIDNKDGFLNYLFTQKYIKMVDDFEDIITFEPLAMFDANLFTKEELLIMNKVKSKLKGLKAKELTEWSHKFKGWVDTKNGEIIDYKYAQFLEL